MSDSRDEITPEADDTLERLVGAVSRTPKVGLLIAPGTMVDHFRVTRLLGSGGMGMVYLARDTRLGRRVALKVLRAEVLGSRESVERFLSEARATARFSHPNITAIHAVGEVRGQPYVALEYLDGQSLRERMTQERLGGQEILRVGLHVARALAEAHDQGVLHRDLKPENVMLPRDGRLRVVDFGLAKLVSSPRPRTETPLTPMPEAETGADLLQTRDKRAFGTPPYISPEQWQARKVTGATDIWSLGIMLYELVFGQRPFEEETALHLALEVSSPTPVPVPAPPGTPGLPPELISLIRDCLAKDAGRRPSAADLAQRLEKLLHGRDRPLGQDESPFRGLLPFDERHQDRFFGRETEIAAFMERVRDEPILSVVGPSGAGKSSFVQAGVIPRLRERGPLEVLRLRPGPRPFHSLATAVAATRRELSFGGRGGPFGTPGRGRQDSVQTWPPDQQPAEGPPADGGPPEQEAVGVDLLAQQLSASPRMLNLLLHRLSEHTDRGVLLLVDQLEELFTLTPEQEVRQRFLEAVCTAADDPALPVRVVLTMREEFLGRLSMSVAVREAFSRITVMRRPGPAALTEALVGPVKAAGYAYEDPELPRQMVDAVAGELSCLPLLQFAGQMLWERRDRERKLLLRSAHDELGGVVGALAQHADGVLTGLTGQQVGLARVMLLRLVTPEGTRRVLSRPRLLEGLPEQQAILVLERLTEARLLAGQKSEELEEAELELVHESLIQTWGRLGRWIEESREELVLLAEMEQAAELWRRRGQRKEEVWQGEALTGARRALDRSTTEVPRLVQQFLEAGERRLRRVLRRRRLRLAAVFGVLALVAVGASLVAAVLSRQKQEVEQQRTEAERQRAASQREGAAAALARGDMLEARAKLRGSLESLDSTAARVLWWRMAGDPLIWKRSSPFISYSVDHSPDGTLLAVASGNSQVVLYDTRSRAVRRVLRGHTDQIFGVAFSPDGRLLASGSWDKQVLLWEVASGRVVRALKGHEGAVHSVRFSPDSQLLASGARDRTVRLWEVKTGHLRHVMRGHPGWVLDLDFSPDGQTLASGGGKALKLWDVRDGRLRLTVPKGKHWVSAVRFSPDGRVLATSSGTQFWLRDAHTGQASVPLVGHTAAIRSLRFSPDGGQLVSAGRDRRVVLWDVRSRRQLRVLRGHQDPVVSASFGPRGRTLASGSMSSVRLWDASVQQRKREPRGHTNLIERLAFSPDGQTLATASKDKTIRLWDTASGRQLRVLDGHDTWVYDVAFTPDGKQLISAGSDHAARLWRLGTGREVMTFRGHNAKINALDLSPDGKLLATASADLGARLWDLGSGRLLRVFSGHTGALWDVTFNPQGRLLATASEDGSVRVWEAATARQIQLLQGHKGRVTSLRFSPDGARLASGGVDGTVWLWDHGSGKGRQVASLGSRIYRLDFHPDGRRIGVPLADSTVRILDLQGGSPTVLRGHTNDVNVVRFDPTGRLAATGSDDFTLRLWHVDSGRPVWRAPVLLSAPPALPTHQGWIQPGSMHGPAAVAPPAKQWQRALAGGGVVASRGEDHLCLVDHGGSLELWDLARDRRLLRQTVTPTSDLGTVAGGCVALSAAGQVRLIRPRGQLLLVPKEATALSMERTEVLVAAGRKVFRFDLAGAPRGSQPTGLGVTALASLGQRLLLGFADGTIEVQGADPASGQESGAPFQKVPGSAVVRLLPGPGGTLFAGFANGELGLWDRQTGIRLHHDRIHGPAVHLLLEQGRLYAASRLGDHLVLDLGVLQTDYCSLMQEVWRSVPVVWSEGRAVLRPVPPAHPCAGSAPGRRRTSSASANISSQPAPLTHSVKPGGR